MKNRFDIIVIGAGPAGLMACREIAKSDSSFAVIEKSESYEKSIFCGEGVWKQPFDNLITPKDSWIRLKITKASFESPNNSTVLLGDGKEVLGYILDRAKMQEDLLTDISEKGILFRGISVKKVEKNQKFQRVTLSNGDELECKTIIDSSGPSSTFSKEFGIYNKPTDLEPALYAIVDNIKDYNSDTLTLKMCSYFGAGGYAWEFPHSKNTVNIGAVIGVDFKGKFSLKERIKEYIEKKYPTGKIVSWSAGSIPCYSSKNSIATTNFISCGDSASMVNPLTRSGISESMKLGIIASEFAIKMSKTESEKEKIKISKEYEKSVWKNYSKKIDKVAKVKKSLYKISDSEFNGAAAELAKIPQKEITMLKILKITIKKSPKLLWAMRHLL